MTYTVSASAANEHQIKAVFLYNFTKGFITWPPSAFANPDDPFHLCILGDDPFGQIIDLTTKGQKAKEGRPLIIDRLGENGAVSSCHILFINNSPSLLSSQDLEITKRLPILTVSNQENFATLGGMVEFFTLDNRVKIAINICVLEQAHLKATTELLKVSKVIRNCPEHN